MALESVYNVLMENFIMWLGVIAALVAFFKEMLGMEGNSVRLLSFVIGIVLAGVFYVSYLIPEIAPYVEGGFFILSAGLIASGFYDLAQNIRNG